MTTMVSLRMHEAHRIWPNVESEHSWWPCSSELCGLEIVCVCQSLPLLLPPKNNVTAGTAWHVLVISVVLGIWDVLSA